MARSMAYVIFEEARTRVSVQTSNPKSVIRRLLTSQSQVLTRLSSRKNPECYESVAWQFQMSAAEIILGLEERNTKHVSISISVVSIQKG